MKLKFSLKNKEASLEADVEKLVEKGMDLKAKNPDRKTRYQIKQEEKRKTLMLKAEEERKKKEAEHKQQIFWLSVLLGIGAVCLILGLVATYLGI